jgi:predicted RNase H-like nuclease (RuvC/YqgF family)
LLSVGSLLESQHDLQLKVEERQQRIAQLEKIIEGKEHGVQNMCQQVNLTSCIMHETNSSGTRWPIKSCNNTIV